MQRLGKLAGQIKAETAGVLAQPGKHNRLCSYTSRTSVIISAKWLSLRLTRVRPPR